MNKIDGRRLAKDLLKNLKEEVKVLKKKPVLAVVSFGDKHSSFISKKEEVAKELEVVFKKIVFNPKLKTREARKEINLIAKSSNIDCIVIQLPLPTNISPALLNVIPPQKDPDVLSDKSVGLFFNDRLKIKPPTAEAIMYALESENLDLTDKKVVLFGAGRLVGRFLIKLLLEKKVQLTVLAHPLEDEEIKRVCFDADIVISSVGQPHFLKADLLPANTTVIDSGFSTLDGKVYGDVKFETSLDKFKIIAKVPGGVGPLGVTMLFKNIIELYKLKNKNKS